MILRWFAPALLAVAALPAAAQQVVAKDPQTIVKALQDQGFTAKLGTDSQGDPMITSAYSGSTFHIYFYNCADNKDCATVQFHSSYDFDEALPLEKFNEWNSRKRFTRAFLDPEKDPVIQMDVDLDKGGVSGPLFLEYLGTWVNLLAEFEKHIGFRS